MVINYNNDSNPWLLLRCYKLSSFSRQGVYNVMFDYSAGKLYVIGGSDGHMSLNSVEVYDTHTQTWSFGPSLSVARTNVGVAVAQGRLFAVGGFSGKAFLDSLEYLAEDGCEWCSSLPLTEVCNGVA